MLGWLWVISLILEVQLFSDVIVLILQVQVFSNMILKTALPLQLF